MMNKIIGTLLALAMIAGCASEEEKDNGITGDAVLQVLLTDAPGDYQEVLIDIDSVLYKMEEADSWESLEMVRSGIYNLLEFTGGLDTLIGETILPAGTMSQMRLVLGGQNQIMKDSAYHALDTPSAQQSGLKFQINTSLEEGKVYRLWIDFDADSSVVETGNGQYKLKPVIRTHVEADTAVAI